MAITLPQDSDYRTAKIVLNNGLEMPAVGMGTYRVRTEQEIFTLVDNGLKAGYRLFDTAAVYGNEAFLGQALRTLLPKYNLEREDIFITSKLAPADHGSVAVPKAFVKSLNNLGLEYIDMYLIHFPGAAKVHNQSPQNALLRTESWKAMIELYDDGKVNAIGVSNYTIAHLTDFESNHLDLPVVNQVEFHPFCNQADLLQYCKSQYICVQAYCSFGGLSVGSNDLIDHPVVKKLAKSYEATPAQVLLVWALQQDVPVIPKATSPQHIEENINLNFRLNEDEIKSLTNLAPATSRYAWDPTHVR
ncbi:unnamed protein product [Colias eurytheme]|nr:unnamed protein product [Colias eurytheme]